MDRVRFFTRAISVPTLIGRTSDGKRIPGGPYTVTQFVGAGVVAFVMWKTAGLWTRGGLLENLLVFGAAVGGTVYGLGKVPATGRNPLSMLAGFANAAVAGTGPSKVGGRAVRTRSPHALTGTVTILDPPSVSDPGAAEPSAPTRARVAVRPARLARPTAAVQLASLAAVRK